MAMAMAMDGGKQEQECSPGAMRSTTSVVGGFGFLVAASLLPVVVFFLAPLYSHLPSVSADVVVYFDVGRSTLFFFCNALLLFLARDSGVLAFFAPPNAMHDAESDARTTVPDGSRCAAVADGNGKVAVVESLGSDLESEDSDCSEFVTTSGAVKSVETTGDVLSEEAVLFSSDLEFDGDGTDDEETDPAEDVEDVQEEQEGLEEFNRRCDEFITRMKSGKS